MIVAVCGWRGEGITTTAVLLAACLADEGDAWLVEADPAGGVLAGRIDVPPTAVGGLERVAFPADIAAPVDAITAAAHRVGGWMLVTAPGDPFRAHACHEPRAPWAAALRDLTGDVVVDTGRLRAGSPTRPLLELADVVVLVTSPEVSAAVASVEWWRAQGRVSALDRPLVDVDVRVVAVDAPSGTAFDPAALRDELGGAWGGWLAWEPDTVRQVQRGIACADRRLRASALLVACRRLVASMRAVAA